MPCRLLRSASLPSGSGGLFSRTCSSGSALGVCCSAAPQVPAALASPPSIFGGFPAGPWAWLLLPSSHDLWVFVQFSTCLRQEVKLESCSSAWARSHCLTAFLPSPRVFLELTSPSSPLSASHVSRGPGGQHLSLVLPGDDIFLVL